MLFAAIMMIFSVPALFGSLKKYGEKETDFSAS
jgi:hypothetical protein